MSKQKNTGPSERELLLSRIKNLVIGSAKMGAERPYTALPAVETPEEAPNVSRICCSCAA